MNVILLLGSLLGISSVMMAAYIDHSLSLTLHGTSLNAVLTAVRYHQLYAIAICILGIVSPLLTNLRIKKWLNLSAYLFITGVMLFSFGIYLSALLVRPSILYLVPMGGVVLMLGWLSLIRTAFLTALPLDKTNDSATRIKLTR